MGKTFKYGYAGNSFGSLHRHSEQKVGNRRKIRRALKDITRVEINDEDYDMCSKFNPSFDNSNYCGTRKPNSIASWNNLNANIIWEENAQEGLVGDTGVNTVIIPNTRSGYSFVDYSYNILHGSLSKRADLIGKKQLKRRGEIGKTLLIKRHDEQINCDLQNIEC